MKKRDDLFLREIDSRAARIERHLKKVSQKKFLSSELHRSAVVRELEVIGEASKQISDETKKKFPEVPWAKIAGMRNRLSHEYFDVDYSTVWAVAKHEIPILRDAFNRAILETAPPVHPWRNCPHGYYHVSSHDRKVKITSKNPDGSTNVREHCRRNPSGKDQLYPDEIRMLVAEAPKAHISISKLAMDPKVKTIDPNAFDEEIVVWSQYWSDLFGETLDPNIVKALMGSESSFNPLASDQRIGKTKNYARGLMQITDQTRMILADEKGELKDHYVTLTPKDVKEPGIAICAAIRWLFHKRELASKYLKRKATWEETVADYKSYLRRKPPWKNSKGMKRFMDYLEKLKEVK